MANQEETVFAALVMHGHRFQRHALPLDVLQELDAYRRLVVDVAKAVFLQNQPGRKRVPKGFEDGFALYVRAVEPGSARKCQR